MLVTAYICYLSTQTLSINVCSRCSETLKSQRRESLYSKRVLEDFYSCNLYFSKPINIFSYDLFWSKCGSNHFHFSHLGLQLCLLYHSKYQTLKNHELRRLANLVKETFNSVNSLWGFGGYFLLRNLRVLPGKGWII